MTRDSLGYPPRTLDSRPVRGVDLHVVDDTGMHSDGLGHRHAPDPVGASGLAVSGDKRRSLIGFLPLVRHALTAG